MKLLLDTHILLRAAVEPDKLSQVATSLIEDIKNEVFFSAASVWEIAIKTSRGRADFRVDPGLVRQGLLDNGYAELPVSGAHAAAVAGLPPIHRDPFDRMLVAQAMVERLTLVTSDPVVAKYPCSVRPV